MDKDSWIILAAFVFIVLFVVIYLMATGTIAVDWNAVFNVKTYPKE